MEKHFKQNGVTFEIKCFESYEKTKADNKARGLSDNELDTTFIEGNLKVTNVRFLKEKYKKESLEVSKNTVIRLYRFIKEIENTKCKISLTEYYS